MRAPLVGSCVALALVASCSSSSTGPQRGTIRLTADQAAAIAHGFARIASTNATLQSLADSISVVVQTGAEIAPVTLTTDLGSGPFYAIGIQRAFLGASVLTTFDVIAFDNPSDPTTFLIIDAYAEGTPAPLESATASFDASDGNALTTGYLLQISGDSVLTWGATTGTVSFASGAPGGTCANVAVPAGATCATEALQAAFSITSSTPKVEYGTQAGAPKASLASVTVPGVRLTFQP